jgi:hypothetical protein
MRSREEDSLVERDAFRANFQWQPQLSKKRGFLPSVFPVRVWYTTLYPESKGRGTRHSQDPRGVLGMIAEPNRNRRASTSLSPTLTLFLAPHGKLYLRLQELVPGRESVRLAAFPHPKTVASSIEIPHAILQATDFSNGYPK